MSALPESTLDPRTVSWIAAELAKGNLPESLYAALIQKGWSAAAVRPYLSTLFGSEARAREALKAYAIDVDGVEEPTSPSLSLLTTTGLRGDPSAPQPGPSQRALPIGNAAAPFALPPKHGPVALQAAVAPVARVGALPAGKKRIRKRIEKDFVIINEHGSELKKFAEDEEALAGPNAPELALRGALQAAIQAEDAAEAQGWIHPRTFMRASRVLWLAVVAYQSWILYNRYFPS